MVSLCSDTASQHEADTLDAELLTHTHVIGPMLCVLQVVLGDRPIEITLTRAWQALPPGRKLSLCWGLLMAQMQAAAPYKQAAATNGRPPAPPLLSADEQRAEHAAAVGAAGPSGATSHAGPGPESEAEAATAGEPRGDADAPGPGPSSQGLVPGPMSAALVDEMMNDDAMGRLSGAMAKEYPEVLGPLLHERDLYLAWSLKRSKVGACVRAWVETGKV